MFYVILFILSIFVFGVFLFSCSEDKSLLTTVAKIIDAGFSGTGAAIITFYLAKYLTNLIS